MKRKVFTYLLIFAMTILSLSFTACNETQPEPEPESNPPAVEVEPEPEPEIAEDGLSGDLNSLMFCLDGVVYSLPVRAAELESNGWEGFWFDWTDYIVNPGETANYGLLTKGVGWDIGVSFFNFSEEALPLNEAHIDRISLDNEWSSRAQLIFPGNILIGSSYDEVIRAHGMPNERGYWSESKEFSYLVYSTEYAAVRITIDNETNLVSVITMYYLRRNSTAEDVPAVITAYEAPTELGDDWREFIVQLNDDLYRLPVPVATFVENGWDGSASATPLHAWINPGAKDFWAFRKNNQPIWVLLRNYDDVIQSDAHAFVVSITIDFARDISFELPGGITEKSTIEEVILAFGTPNEVREVLERRQYIFGDEESHINIAIDVETGEIQFIVIRHSPESLS